MPDRSGPGCPFEHLYIHVPFCRRRCSYCDFAISVRRRIPSARFIDAIVRELEIRRVEWTPVGKIRSVYLGGGTPSLLGSGELERLIRFVLREWIADPDGVEMTIEVNPDDVTPAAVKRWSNIGINRASLGVQSLQSHTLAWMHRTHTARQALEALNILAAEGIGSLSVDVIFGLPEEAGADPLADTEALLQAEAVTHVSAYGLSVEAGTSLAKWRARGREVSASEDRYVADFRDLHVLLTGAGYEHYEVSNYARPGYRSVHNSGYWTGAPYLGVGPSAHSFADNTRWWNVRHWAEYDRLVGRGRDPIEEREQLDRSSRWLETVYVGLRTAAGLSEEVARFLPVHQVERLEALGLLHREDGRVSATIEGWLRLDEVVSHLTTSREGG